MQNFLFCHFLRMTMRMRMRTKIRAPRRNPATRTRTSSAPSTSLERTGCAGHASSNANHPGGPMRSGGVIQWSHWPLPPPSEGGRSLPECFVTVCLFLFFIECLLVFIWPTFQTGGEVCFIFWSESRGGVCTEFDRRGEGRSLLVVVGYRWGRSQCSASNQPSAWENY